MRTDYFQLQIPQLLNEYTILGGFLFFLSQ